MATLQELLDLEGVVVAGEFDFDGSMLDYEANMDMSEAMAQMTAEFCAAVSVMLNTLASSFAERSGMNWCLNTAGRTLAGSGRHASETVEDGECSWRRPRLTSTGCLRLWATSGS